jgi:uncharacterized protein (TIGR00297 family)
MSKRKRLVLGLFLSSAISLLAYQRRSLSRSGAAGAITTGTLTFGLGGLAWGLSLIHFFVSSSLFSHYRERDKVQTATDKFSKGGQRDIAQVGANGAIATLMAIGHSLTPSSSLRQTLEAGYVGALATATADTWATELGVLSATAPRLITTGQTTLPGTSGGITPLGTAAAASGAFSLGLVFRLLHKRHASWALPPIALLSGLIGSLFDSWLGATYQAMYYCPACQKETERRTHSCGKPTQPLRGLSWMDNDVVNFLATFVGSMLAILLHVLAPRQSRQQS